MKELYTATGRFEKRHSGFGKQYPVVVVGEKEHVLDIHEMIIWTALNWRISDRLQIETFYNQKLSEIGVVAEKGCIVYIERLLFRGLLMKGSGETDTDALYDLFSELYIVPISGNIFFKTAFFLKITLLQGVSFRTAKRAIFQKAMYTADEKQVLNLSRQTMLSTAELMKCVETGVSDISSDNKLTDALFTDDYTTSDNLIFTAKTFNCMIPVLTAVANLYLRKQIIFTKEGTT